MRRAGLAAVLVVVLVATLTPAGGPPRPEACLFCSDNALADALRNVLLFAPLGVMLALNRWRGRRAIVSAILLSIVVELAQLFIPGRDASVSDVISNGAGAALGFAVSRNAAAWLLPPRRLSALLAAAAAALAGIVALGTRWLEEPSLPLATYYGQWTAEFGDMARYDGRIDSVELAGTRLPGWDWKESAFARGALLGGAALEVHATAGAPTGALAPIFSVMDDRQRLILLLGADRRDLVLRYRMRAADWRLEQPEQRIREALTSAPGARLDLTVEHLGPDACLTINARRACPALGVADGWALLVSVGRASPYRPLAGVLWVLALLAPACWWGARALAPEGKRPR